MKLLSSEKWQVQGYNDVYKAWEFINRSLKDWEICIVPNAKFINREDNMLTYYNSDGSKSSKHLNLASNSKCY